MGQTSAEDHAYHRGEMDIRDHASTFAGFMGATVWGTALIVMAVASLTVAFALGGGWLGGLLVWLALGVGAGFALKLGAGWWGTVIATTALALVGGGLATLVGVLM